MGVIILAGGLGTRLQSVISEIPKPMAPILNKPFLYYVLNWLDKNKVTKAILSVGYKADVILKEFGNRFNTIELIYSFEEVPLCTGVKLLIGVDDKGQEEGVDDQRQLMVRFPIRRLDIWVYQKKLIYLLKKPFL